MNDNHTSHVADPGRRHFLQDLGAGALATAALMSGCGEGGSKRTATDAPSLTGEIPTDQMSCRTNS